MSEYLSAPLEKLLTIIKRETTKALTGQALSDVLAAFQGMSDRRRLGIKNEAEGYGLIPLTQGKFAIVDAEDFDAENRTFSYQQIHAKKHYLAIKPRF